MTDAGPAPLPAGKRALMVVMIEVIPLAGFAAAVWAGLRDSLGWLDLGLFAGMYLFTMAGIEIGFHRYLTHRQLELAPALRALLLVGGSMAGEGSPLLWAAIHRRHHAHSDRAGDPHSPVLGRGDGWQRLRGFLWAQFLWYTTVPAITRFHRVVHRRPGRERDRREDGPEEVQLARLVTDRLREPELLRLDRLYPLWIAFGFALPAAAGGLLAGSWTGALHGLLWGGFARHFVVKQITFAINSVGHTVGVRSLDSRDHSRNNLIMALLTLGSGWHNNHHALPAVARLDFRWWQLDPGGWLIELWRRMGLAWNVRLASPEAVAAHRKKG